MTGTSGPSISISRIVDAEADERRQQMLDGRDEDAARIAEHGAELGRADRRGKRAGISTSGEPATPVRRKDDAAVRDRPGRA